MSLESHYRLETPEQIEMEFDLAGPGSRACAMLIDGALMFLLIAATVIVLLVAGMSLGPLLEGRPEQVLGRWALAILIAMLFVLTFGYFVICEMLMNGSTPGKRQLRLRTIREDGTPVTLVESLIRNLLRIVDFLPAGYLLGMIVCMCHPMHKRVGDLAAGTIVVKEGEPDYRSKTDKRVNYEARRIEMANTELTASERKTIQAFLSRRWQLLPEARQSLAQRIAGPLHEKYGGDFDHAEHYLTRLAEGRHYER